MHKIQLLTYLVSTTQQTRDRGNKKRCEKQHCQLRNNVKRNVLNIGFAKTFLVSEFAWQRILGIWTHRKFFFKKTQKVFQKDHQ